MHHWLRGMDVPGVDPLTMSFIGFPMHFGTRSSLRGRGYLHRSALL